MIDLINSNILFTTAVLDSIPKNNLKKYTLFTPNPYKNIKTMEDLQNINLDNYWMPFTPNRKFKSDPRLIVASEGMYYKTQDGRSVLMGNNDNRILLRSSTSKR